ncbi:hypothetical protein WALSEDRAFT_33913 [Wallemia mellicola CBS 633.66]|uniref:Uncharacterized protein n=1 Tax=Wallemia mellicola (strain ATCC MYA-4683 / CBS 633.66) TaxID=671144 RepID=I4Y6R4_WALMC|nr:hypothetical protein WALSEDRAFT_33913 [Wallemia mellicola CBS 633.66]EIM19656.1 hypothetical protein WALSEDRAFT_33913 [Wallemia mellicola CBS 633.66]|eukprot:XP_006960318.1 hypothetical protein WALSEDRAFT_33913 [Wallemia mellicola CBS 633.66]
MLGYEPAPLMPTAAVPGILIVSASGRDVACALPNNLSDAMASAKERWSIPNDLVFRLGVKKKDAPGYLANTAQGDLIILGDDAVYQLVKMGKSVLRTEIQVYASKEVKPKEEKPPPPPPEPVPIKITVENSKGKMFRLDTKALPDINMDWSQSQGGQSMVGSFLGQLTIKPQTDPEGRITFSGKEIPNDLNFSTFTNNKNEMKTVQFRKSSSKPFIQIFSPIEQFLTLELSLSGSWQCKSTWPASEIKKEKEKQLVGFFLRVGPGTTIEDVVSGCKTAGLSWEAVPNAGCPRLSPDDKTPFDPANPDLVDYNGVLLSAKDCPARLDKILAEQFKIDPLVRTNFMADITPHLFRYPNIAFRFLPQDFYEPAATLAIRPTPEVTGRIFLLWQGVTDADKWKASKKRDKMPINWAEIVGFNTESLTNDSLFRCIEVGWMEVVS